MVRSIVLLCVNDFVLESVVFDSDNRQPSASNCHIQYQCSFQANCTSPL